MLIEGERRAPGPSGPGKIRCRGSREPNGKLVYWFNSYGRRAGLSTRRVRITGIAPGFAGLGHARRAHSTPDRRSVYQALSETCFGLGDAPASPVERDARRRPPVRHVDETHVGRVKRAFCRNSLRPLAARRRNISHAQRYAVDRRRGAVLSNESEDQCTNIPETSASRSCGNRRELGGLAGPLWRSPRRMASRTRNGQGRTAGKRVGQSVSPTALRRHPTMPSE
ncbi:hypothetical protein [Azospirillum argentinense]